MCSYFFLIKYLKGFIYLQVLCATNWYNSSQPYFKFDLKVGNYF